jgi:hypothetical protein
MMKPPATEQTIPQTLPAAAQTVNGAPALAAVEAVAPPQLCGTVLLDDVPEQTDAFSDQQQNLFGPHQTVAEVIAGMIQSPVPKGIAIGLEGSWGSGKTTVVKLLAAALKDAPNITLIPFDAWAHEGDTLRRTFLEKMIKHLKKIGWVNKETWDAELEKIAKRKDVTVTKQFPQFSGWGRAVGLLLLLVPLGGTLFGQALREPYTFTNTGHVAWRFVIEFLFGLVLSFAPFLILLKKQARDKGVMELMISKVVTENRTETEKTPNATSIEFEEYFQMLMGEALKDESHRLILVLDNLDRVDTKEALSIWSTLQTFMQHKQDDTTLWYKRLWTLVLYDPKALSLLWQGKDKEQSAAQAPAQNEQTEVAIAGEETAQAGPGALSKSAPPKAEARNGSSAIATSFIDKSFQIRFEVSPPVPSNWYSFLIERLCEAFPAHSDDDSQFHAIYRVLSIDRVLSGQPTPTIRELKLYVNQIGALHRQLVLRGKCRGTGKSSFPLSLLAYYVLLRRRRPNADIADGVLKNKLPESDFEGLLGEQVGDKLAALHYNVEISLARQVILGPKIEGALQNGDQKLLISYADNPKAFWQVLGDIIDKWVSTESNTICKAASSLDDPNLLGSTDRRSQRVLGILRDIALKVTEWMPLDEVRASGIVSLFNIIQKKEFAAKLLENIVSDFSRDDHLDLNSAFIDVPDFVEKLQVVLAKTNELGWAELYEQSVVELLGRQVRGEPLPDEKLVKLLETLFELSRTEANAPGTLDPATSALRSLVSNLHLSRQLNNYEKRGDAAAAWCVFLIIRDNPQTALPLLLARGAESSPDNDSPPQPLEDINNLPGEFFQAFVRLLARKNAWELLFAMLETDVDYQLMVLQTLRQSRTVEFLNFAINPALFLKHWQFLHRKLELEVSAYGLFDQLLKVLLARTSLKDEIERAGFDAERAPLYSAIDKFTKGEDRFRDWLRRNLQTVSQDVWESQFRSEGQLLELVSTLAAANIEFDPGTSSYEEALLNYAKDVMTGSVLPKLPWSNLTSVLNHQQSRPAFREKLDEAFAERVRQTSGNVAPAFFDLFGGELLEAEQPGPGAGVIPLLLPALLSKRDLSGLRWVAAMLDKYQAIDFSTATESDGRAFQQSLLDVLTNESDEITDELVIKIAERFHVFSSNNVIKLYEQLLERYMQTRSYKIAPLLKQMWEQRDFFSMSKDGTHDIADIARKLKRLELIVSPMPNHLTVRRLIAQVLQEYVLKEQEMTQTFGVGSKVYYVVNRPYSAGETPEIQVAVVEEFDKVSRVATLRIGEQTIEGVRYSLIGEPGTYHFGL